jgi:hypothetical protein
LLPRVTKAPRKPPVDWIARVLSGPEGARSAVPQAVGEPAPRDPPDDALRKRWRRPSKKDRTPPES